MGKDRDKRMGIAYRTLLSWCAGGTTDSRSGSLDYRTKNRLRRHHNERFFPSVCILHHRKPKIVVRSPVPDDIVQHSWKNTTN